MKHSALFLLILLIGALGSCQGISSKAQQEVSSPTNVATSKDDVEFLRINMPVKDIDMSMKVYVEILGLSYEEITDMRKGAFSYSVLNIPNEADLRFCALDSPSQKRVLGLMEVKGVELEGWKKIKPMYLMFKGKELSKMKQQVAALGLPSSVIKVNPIEGGSFNEFSFEDFDGHSIFMYEIIKS